MKGEYEPDTFTENDVINCLQGQELRYKNGSRYILSQCPTHVDRNPSVQIYKDDWFVNCHAGCGRYHITKAFPELRRNRETMVGAEQYKNRSVHRTTKIVHEMKYKTYDLMSEWLKMPEIPESHGLFKNMEIEHLTSLGWRWVEEKNAYFIPYFSSSKDSIPFAQYRYLSGNLRFTFLKDAKPTMYGTWNLGTSDKVFIVEGTSDLAVLDYCAVPCVAAPSAASGQLVKSMAMWSVENGIQLIYAGDNDTAGDKLLEALASVAPYRKCQPPKKYKDWGDFFVAEGQLAVIDWCSGELGGGENENDSQMQAVLDVFPGSVQLEII